MAGRPTVITQEIVAEYQKLLDSGITKFQASRQLGFSPKGLATAAKRYGNEIPLSKRGKRRGDIKKEFLRRVPEFQKRQLSQHQIAAELGARQPYICHLFRKFGISPTVTPKDKSLEKCKQVVDYIMENGGYIPAAIEKLGLSVYRGDVRKYCKDNGIDIQKYRYMNMEFGYWRVVEPEWRPFSTSDFHVLVLCTKCNVTKSFVSISNLRSGKTTCCSSCRYEQPNYNRRVVCNETGEKFTSIMRMTKDVGVFNRYQQIRIQLLNNGSFEHDGLTYSLTP